MPSSSVHGGQLSPWPGETGSPVARASFSCDEALPIFMGCSSAGSLHSPRSGSAAELLGGLLLVKPTVNGPTGSNKNGPTGSQRGQTCVKRGQTELRRDRPE